MPNYDLVKHKRCGAVSFFYFDCLAPLFCIWYANICEVLNTGPPFYFVSYEFGNYLNKAKLLDSYELLKESYVVI